MRTLISLLVAFLSLSVLNAQSPDESAIREVLTRQQQCWNAGDIYCFMDGYWKSDNLMFIGSKGVTYGWDQTLDNYKKSYPSQQEMGTLTFELLLLEPLSEDFWNVIGKWTLKRKSDRPTGHFTLLFRKFGNEWLIVQDHSS